MTSPAMRGRSGNAFDVAGPNGQVGCHQEPSNHRGVSDDTVLDGENVKPAHGVVPIIVGETILEGLLQQCTEGPQLE